MTYAEFLADKASIAEASGLPCDPSEVHPYLKPHQRDTVAWAVRGGRRAIFAAFGLGKTLMQLEAVRLAIAKSGGTRGLIVMPLGVRQEFIRDAGKIDLTVRFIRTIEEADGAGIYLTNYETVRDGKLDPRAFDVISLDEAAVLRGFGGTKTFRELMRMYEGSGAFRFVATATPSPNDYIELLAYAAFLDVMDVGQAKTRFFRRDSEKADRLTLHPHKEAEFWLWVASWAMFLQTPSDLGYSDEGYSLPPLEVRWHELTSGAEAGFDRHGRGRLFADSSMGVSEAAREKRASLEARVAKAVRLVCDGREGARSAQASDRGVQGLSADVPTGQVSPAEGGGDPRGEGASAGLPEGVPDHASGQLGAPDGAGARAALRRDAGDVPGDVRGPGRRVRDLPADAGAAEDRSRPLDGQSAGPALPAVQRGARAAGRLDRDGTSRRGLPDQMVIWAELNDEQRAIERALAAVGVSFSSLYGNQSIEEKDRLLAEWLAGETDVFLSKPVMYGSGVNLQQAHRMIFTGLTFKFSDTIQAVHRIHRFLQDQPVTIDLIYTEAEREVRKLLERKWAQHDAQMARMGEIIREYGLSHEAMASVMRRSIGVERRELTGDGYRLVNADAVEEASRLDSDSVDLIVTSIPFATQYEYTPSYNDFGHTESNAHFWAQMDFLTPELLRVLRPGRIAAVHVKDRIVPGGITGLGFQTVQPFHAEAIEHYRRHGFAFMGMKTIVTDVVRENNQTYRLGWTEQCKDGTKMGAGLPEYLLLFRRPPTDRSDGYADVPVVKSKLEYSRSRWQIDAHGFARSNGNRPLSAADVEGIDHDVIYRMFREHGLGSVYDFEEHVALGEALEQKNRLPVTFMLLPPPSWHPDVWTDVARMRTLNLRQFQRGEEYHLCPLQFDIVDRLIAQYSMPGETVLDPFMGIGTVPYCAVKAHRLAVGIELSAAYFRDASFYVTAAAQEASAPTLFDLTEALAPVAVAS